jgi:UDP-glucuronate 4-epimerase
MEILVTGAAGFIGFHVSLRLLQLNCTLVGVDNLNDYYNVSLKTDRLNQLLLFPNFKFYKLNINNEELMEDVFAESNFDYVIHLAAQAGVRYSINHPMPYIESNIVGFVQLLEMLRKYPVKRLFYASSSSVYGNSTEVPFSTNNRTDSPISLYAATKKANEVIMHAYQNLYDIRSTGLRFFTVYGPWGRPDMAYYSFAEAIMNHQPIKVFNQGKLSRDFTFIDDITDAILALLNLDQTQPERLSNNSIYNIGNNHPVALEEFIFTLENLLGVDAIKEYVEMQPGDVLTTYADISPLKELIGYEPKTTLKDGLQIFVDWFKIYKEKKR